MGIGGLDSAKWQKSREGTHRELLMRKIQKMNNVHLLHLSTNRAVAGWKVQ